MAQRLVSSAVARCLSKVKAGSLRRTMSTAADNSKMSWVGRKRTVHDVDGYTPFRPISPKEKLPEPAPPTPENFSYYHQFAEHQASKTQQWIAFGITFVCGYWMAARGKEELPLMFGTGKPWDHH